MVDDEQAIVDVLAYNLVKAGHEPIVARDGEQVTRIGALGGEGRFHRAAIAELSGQIARVDAADPVCAGGRAE